MSEISILEDELRTASSIIEWEFGDIIGHIGVRLPNGTIAVKLLRVAQENKQQDWLMQFDMEGMKLSGTGTVPGEAVIYTQLFKAKPDVQAIVHAHPPMCVALALAQVPIKGVHLQSSRFGDGLPVYPLPMYVSDPEDGDTIAETIGDAPGMTINGHGIVTVGKSVDEALFHAVYMERTARMIFAARTLGFQDVSADFRQEMAGNAAKIQGRQASISRPKVEHSDEWRYYTRKLEQGETWNRGWV